MIVLDASVLIGHLDGHDSHHRRARQLLEQSAASPLGASPVSLAETLVAPARVGRLDAAREALDQDRDRRAAALARTRPLAWRRCVPPRVASSPTAACCWPPRTTPAPWRPSTWIWLEPLAISVSACSEAGVMRRYSNPKVKDRLARLDLDSEPVDFKSSFRFGSAT